MPRDFFDPTPEEQVIVLVEDETIRNAEGFIKSCEHCNPEEAEWPFNVVLDRVYRLRSERLRITFWNTQRSARIAAATSAKNSHEPS